MDPLQQDQEDFFARLDGDPYMVDVTVLLQRKGVTESDIETALSVLNEKVGKIGACLIVLKSALVPSNPDTAGPEFFVETTVQAITQPLFNDGDTGTGKVTEALAQRVRVLGHYFKGYTFNRQLPEEVEVGKDSYSVTFRRLARDADRRCGTPLITPDSGAVPQEVTLNTGTEGASIRYSLDGSYPDEATGTLYAGAFTVNAAAILRAVAYKDGFIASDIAEAEFT